MLLLIIGATGGTGRELVKQALERGHQVTAFVRTPARLRLAYERLTVVRGDVLDRSSVEAAGRGHDAVPSALGHKRGFYPARVLSAGPANILGATGACGVRRLLCETALRRGESCGRMGVYYTA